MCIPSLPGPVSMDHIHLDHPQADIPAIQAWYAKVFGGIPGKRQRVALPGLTDCNYFHRFNLSDPAGEGKLVPTKTRELDHLGFDVKNIDEFEKRLVAQGLKFEAPPRQVPNTQARVASPTIRGARILKSQSILRPDFPLFSSHTVVVSSSDTGNGMVRLQP